MTNSIKYIGLGLAVLTVLGAGIYWKTTFGTPVSIESKVIPKDGKISLTQLKNNKNSTSCWSSVNKVVYDVTSYVSKHPGGAELYNGCGKEIENLFPKHPGGRFDSESNKSLLEKFKIGTLEN
jgi:cytochrome b involved in lipid metabolism